MRWISRDVLKKAAFRHLSFNAQREINNRNMYAELKDKHARLVWRKFFFEWKDLYQYFSKFTSSKMNYT